MPQLAFEKLVLGGPASPALGVSTQGNTAGTTGLRSGSVVLAGLGAISLSQTTGPGGAGTISISADAATANFYKNIASQGQTIATIQNNIVNVNTMLLTYAPIDPKYAFPFNMAPQMLVLDLNQSVTAGMADISRNTAFTGTVNVTQSSTLGQTWSVGIYTISGSSTLALMNSISVAFSESTSRSASLGTTSSSSFATLGYTFTQSVGGPRWLVLNSSGWSSSLSFRRGVEYVIAIGVSAGTSRSSSADQPTASVTVAGASWAQSFSITGQALAGAALGTRRGTMGSASASASSLGALQYAGIFSVTTSTLPTTVGLGDLVRTSGTVIVPHVMLNNYGAGIL